MAGPQGVSPMHPPLVINRRNEHFPIGIPAMFDSRRGMESAQPLEAKKYGGYPAMEL